MADPDLPPVAMRHAETELVAEVPAAAVAVWRPLGWTPVAELDAALPKDVPPSAAEPTEPRPAARKRTTTEE